MNLSRRQPVERAPCRSGTGRDARRPGCSPAVAPGWMPGICCEVGGQVVRVLAPAGRLRHELLDLLQEHDRLDLRHAVVVAAGEAAAALVGPAGAAAVVEGVALVDRVRRYRR